MQPINEESSLIHQKGSDDNVMDETWVSKNIIMLSNSLGKILFNHKNNISNKIFFEN